MSAGDLSLICMLQEMSHYHFNRESERRATTKSSLSYPLSYGPGPPDPRSPPSSRHCLYRFLNQKPHRWKWQMLLTSNIKAHHPVVVLEARTHRKTFVPMTTRRENTPMLLLWCMLMLQELSPTFQFKGRECSNAQSPAVMLFRRSFSFHFWFVFSGHGDLMPYSAWMFAF